VVSSSSSSDEEPEWETSPVPASAPENSAEQKSSEPLGVLSHHLKLGLGDFVFYSVLTGTSVRSGGLIAFVCCTVAIWTGLLATLLLLITLKMPLPALPISLTLGMIFFATSSIVAEPFLRFLFNRQIYI